MRLHLGTVLLPDGAALIYQVHGMQWQAAPLAGEKGI